VKLLVTLELLLGLLSLMLHQHVTAAHAGLCFLKGFLILALRQQDQIKLIDDFNCLIVLAIHH
jgi:hypothetical protein